MIVEVNWCREDITFCYSNSKTPWQDFQEFANKKADLLKGKDITIYYFSITKRFPKIKNVKNISNINILKRVYTQETRPRVIFMDYERDRYWGWTSPHVYMLVTTEKIIKESIVKILTDGEMLDWSPCCYITKNYFKNALQIIKK